MGHNSISLVSVKCSLSEMNFQDSDQRLFFFSLHFPVADFHFAISA